ncbi:TerD family protein [Streptomyces sp. URMC 127]|uniref:TerD family protein n=1 Tax=Streptomyces sp. URMC 127 TaxID=3423402 RepID=UPI003F1B5969
MGTSCSSTTRPRLRTRSFTPAKTIPARARVLRADRRRLQSLPAPTGSVAFVVSIHNEGGAVSTFVRVRDAFIRVGHQATGMEMCRIELSADAHVQTAMVSGQLYRREGKWKFRAIGQGYASGLAGIAKDYGVNV